MSSNKKGPWQLASADGGMASMTRVIGGVAGWRPSKLDAAMTALGVVVVEPRYLDALATLSQVGASCACARQGLGVCGGVR